MDARVILITFALAGLWFGGGKAVHGAKIAAHKVSHAIAHVLHHAKAK